MVDIAAISAGMTSIKTALEITKELRHIDSSLRDAEVKLKLADLIEALSDAKIQLSDVRDENQELKEKIKALEKQLEQIDEVYFEKGHYFLNNVKDGQAKGPFCAKCYGDDNKLILVTELPKGFQDLGKYRCPKCGSTTN